MKKVACALFHHCFLHLVSHADYVYAGRQLDVARRAAIDYAAACVIDNGRGFRAQNVQHAIRAAYAEQVVGGRAQGGRVLQSEGGRKRNVFGYADGAPGVGVAVAPLHEHVAIVGGRLDVGFRAVVVYAITQHAAHVLAPVGHVERYDTFFRRPYGVERNGAVVFGGQVDDFLPVVVCFHADVVFGPSGKVAPCTCEVVRGQGLGDIVGERLRFHAALCLVGVRVEGYGIGVCCPAGIQVHVFRQYGFALYGFAAGFCGVPFGGVSCAFRHGQRDCGAVVPVSVVSRFAVLQMEAVHLVACVLPQGIAVCPDGLSPCGGCHGMLQLPGYFAGGELFRGVCFGLCGHVVAVVAACGSACQVVATFQRSGVPAGDAACVAVAAYGARAVTACYGARVVSGYAAAMGVAGYPGGVVGRLPGLEAVKGYAPVFVVHFNVEQGLVGVPRGVVFIPRDGQVHVVPVVERAGLEREDEIYGRRCLPAGARCRPEVLVPDVIVYAGVVFCDAFVGCALPAAVLDYEAVREPVAFRVVVAYASDEFTAFYFVIFIILVFH